MIRSLSIFQKGNDMKVKIFLYCFLISLFSHVSCAKTPASAIDQKVYAWICSMQRPNGLVEESNRANMVSLYSNALAAIVFTSQKDYQRAEQIFQWFKDNKNEFDTPPGGFSQFRDVQGFTAKPHRWMGDNCWLLIALKYYQEQTGSSQFQVLALDIESWVRTLQDEDGGLWGGFKNNKARIAKNVEGNIDALNAVPGYDMFHEKLFQYLTTKRWDSENNVFRGDGFPYTYAPDFISWGYMALGDQYVDFLNFAEKYYTTTTSSLGPQVTGIRFDLVEDDGVWLEATGQMALAYKVAGMDKKASFLISEIEKMYVESRDRLNQGGIVYSTNRGTSFGPQKLWLGADRKPALGTSCWYLLAKWGIDPMAIGRADFIKGQNQ